MALTTKVDLGRQGKTASITSSSDVLATGCILSSHLASAAVDGTALATDAITASHIGAALIAGSHLGSAIVAGSNIASGTIDASHLSFSPAVAANVIYAEELAVSSSGQTACTLASTPAGQVAVMMNGVQLKPGSGFDYEVAGKVVTFKFELDGSEACLANYTAA